MTPYTVLVSLPYPYPKFLPPPLGRQWCGLSAPNSVLLLSMVRKRPGRKFDSALR